MALNRLLTRVVLNSKGEMVPLDGELFVFMGLKDQHFPVKSVIRTPRLF